VSEAEFTSQVIQYAALFGWASAHFRPGMTQSGRWVTAVQGDGKGFPDLLLVKPKRLVVAELKVGRNRVTGEQRAWLRRFELAGVPAYTWRPGDWPEIERVLGGRK
jgi:hypothetical protein